MKNDDNFDEIRKKLYDLESDPPSDGWKNIRLELDEPADSLFGAYFKKHWWKPLILLLPLIAYFSWPETPPKDNLPIAEISGDFTPPAENPEVANIKERVVTEKNVMKEEESEGITVEARDEVNKPLADTKVAEVQSSNNLIADQTKDNAQINPVNETDDASDQHQNHFIDSKEETTIEENIAQEDISNHKEIAPSRLFSMKPRKEVPVDSVVIDSVIVDPVLVEETLTSVNDDEPDEKHPTKNWKLFLSFSPQYIYRSIKPVANDEVLITSVNNQNENYPERIGYNISAGVGKEIVSNLYLEGKLSFNRLSDNISYTYSTGVLDTLLKHYRADGIVEVTAVYDYHTREISSKGIFGGVKLGATYYFLMNQKQGLNLSASAGMNFLLNSKVSEKIDGRWIEMEDGKVEDINYDLLIGLGYNRKIGKDFELMVMPTFIYYLNQNPASSQPFVIHQHAYGLQFMVSKYL